MARKIYQGTPLAEQGEKKARLAEILSVTPRTVQDWLSRIDKDNKEKRESEIVKLYFACYTQEETAQAVGMSHQGVSKVLQQIPSFEFVAELGDHAEIDDEKERMAVIAEENRDNATHATDFVAPIYNVWKQQEKTAGSSHFGNSEVRWLGNLLYLYIEPFGVVVDPFAGGGSTIDICKKRKFLHPGPLNGRGGEFLHISVDHLHLLQVECMARRFHHQSIREAEFSVQNS